jgi:integrase
LAGRRNLRPSTRRSYHDELVKARLGHIKLQELTKAHLDALVTELEKSGRRVGNVQHQGLSGRSVNGALSRLASVLDDTVKQGTLPRNVAKFVERAPHIRKETSTWTEAQAATFLETVAEHRLNAAWQLSFYGLRRGEVLGLCWSDIDLSAKTLTITRARVEVTGEGVVEVPRPNVASEHCRSMTLW